MWQGRRQKKFFFKFKLSWDKQQMINKYVRHYSFKKPTPHEAYHLALSHIYILKMCEEFWMFDSSWGDYPAGKLTPSI